MRSGRLRHNARGGAVRSHTGKVIKGRGRDERTSLRRGRTRRQGPLHRPSALASDSRPGRLPLYCRVLCELCQFLCQTAFTAGRYG